MNKEIMNKETQKRIQHDLKTMQDAAYRDFQAKLIPNIDKGKIIGVRMPLLRAYAKKLCEDEPETARGFMQSLPHDFYEENNLHGLLISNLANSAEEALDAVDAFLPCVDNWATCDLLPPKIFRKNLREVRRRIMPWLASADTYRVRFALVSLLTFFLEEEFEQNDLTLIAEIDSEEYYINIAAAWYYSFALIKQYDNTIGLFEAQTLKPWVQNKSIQKAIESFRIPPEKKAYLRTLKIKPSKKKGA